MPNKDNRTSNTNNRSKKSESSKPASAYRGLDLKELAGYDLNFGYTFIVLHQSGTDRSKTPFHKNWQEFDNDRFDPREWMRKGHNIGIRIDSGLLVIDADPRNYLDGDDPLERLLKDFGLRLENIPHVVTGGGGYHLYFRLPIQRVKLRLTHPRYLGIEFKTNGQVVAAGSVHPNGITYEWGLFSPLVSKTPLVPIKLIKMLLRVRNDSDRSVGAHTPEHLEIMLSGLNPMDFRAQEKWLELMMACHHATGGEGEDIFTAWSTHDPNYADHDEIIRKRWQSLSSDGTDKVTYDTLYKILHASRKGHLIPPIQTATEAFGAVDAEDIKQYL